MAIGVILTIYSTYVQSPRRMISDEETMRKRVNVFLPPYTVDGYIPSSKYIVSAQGAG